MSKENREAYPHIKIGSRWKLVGDGWKFARRTSQKDTSYTAVVYEIDWDSCEAHVYSEDERLHDRWVPFSVLVTPEDQEPIKKNRDTRFYKASSVPSWLSVINEKGERLIVFADGLFSNTSVSITVFQGEHTAPADEVNNATPEELLRMLARHLGYEIS